MSENKAPQGFAEHPRPPIKLHPVESSQIAAVGYDPSSETLAVRFKHGAGAIYHYTGVSRETYDAFISAESLGKHFTKNIKPLAFDKFPPEMAE